MIIKRVVLNLSSAETLGLTRILLDEDKEEALLFLKECLGLNCWRRPGIIECQSLRLRISLLKRTPSANISRW